MFALKLSLREIFMEIHFKKEFFFDVFFMKCLDDENRRHKSTSHEISLYQPVIQIAYDSIKNVYLLWFSISTWILSCCSPKSSSGFVFTRKFDLVFPFPFSHVPLSTFDFHRQFYWVFNVSRLWCKWTRKKFFLYIFASYFRFQFWLDCYYVKTTKRMKAKMKNEREEEFVLMMSMCTNNWSTFEEMKILHFSE